MQELEKLQIHIYSPSVTPRIQYIFKWVCHSFLGAEPVFHTHIDEFSMQDGIKINYSTGPIHGSIWIIPYGLLQETGVRNFTPFQLENENFKAIFPVKSGASLPFDPFSAAFYLVSRYEEYLPFEADRHGRFTAVNCFSMKHGLLTEPLIDQWMLKLVSLITESFQGAHIPPRTFVMKPTIDIDNAWAYLNKPFLRCIGSAGKDILSGRFKWISERLAVLSGKKADPFDTYSLLDKIHAENDMDPVWFFLLGDHGPHDMNIHYRNPAFQALIKDIASRYQTGIHPSYASNTKEGLLEEEIHRLQFITGAPVINSRQHFLKLSFPGTLRKLSLAGISNDYSLGFHDQPGFRAGTCTPFPFYDLLEEKEHTLILHPFMVMDRTFSDYLKITPGEAWVATKSILDKVKNVKGTFISIFHNEVIDRKDPNVWFELYQRILSYK
jgi:hypothetical protein